MCELRVICSTIMAGLIPLNCNPYSEKTAQQSTGAMAAIQVQSQANVHFRHTNTVYVLYFWRVLVGVVGAGGGYAEETDNDPPL